MGLDHCHTAIGCKEDDMYFYDTDKEAELCHR